MLTRGPMLQTVEHVWMVTEGSGLKAVLNQALKTGLNAFFLFGIVKQNTKRQQIRNYMKSLVYVRSW